MSLNLAVILREAALAHPDKEAVVLDPFRFTYAQLDALSNQVASSLRAKGIKPGDRVAVLLPNVPHFPIVYFGILKAGAVMVPMNVLLKAAEINYHLSDSGARLLIAWQDFSAEAMKGAPPGTEIYIVSRPDTEDLPPGARSFTDLLQGDGGFDMEPTSPDATAVILYTSGTTGRPKGAELTHLNLFMNCDVGGRLFGIREDDRSAAVLPFFHVFGLSSVLNVTVRFGGTLCLVPRFEVPALCETIAKERVTVFSGVPTMFFALLNSPAVTADKLASLRVAVSGGASMPGEVLMGFERKFGVTILEGYGLSESTSGASFNRSLEERRILSIGKPLWGVEMRIVDEQENPLPSGADNIGEICLRGHNVMKGYHNNPQATEEAFKGGWFHTGDMGYVDADGFYFIVDRKKELIIRGGFNVYPREVEEILYAHPAVQEAAVIGVPDERLGEEVSAVVAFRPGQSATEADLIAFCRERIAAYKYPRSIRVVQTLPKGPTGKILKKELKAQIAAGPPG